MAESLVISIVGIYQKSRAKSRRERGTEKETGQRTGLERRQNKTYFVRWSKFSVEPQSSHKIKWAMS